jgi:hypothetical protein
MLHRRITGSRLRRQEIVEKFTPEESSSFIGRADAALSAGSYTHQT